MQDKIYKINSITLDEENQEFCLSHDHGLKTYDIGEFKENQTSDNLNFNLGSIALAHYFPEIDDLIAFTGSTKNVDFPPDMIVFFDINKKIIVFKKKLEKEITNFKVVSNFILIAFGKSLIIFYYDKDKNDIELKQEHKIEENSLFECWIEKTTNHLYLAFPLQKEIKLQQYATDEWAFIKKLDITSPVNVIQNIFYVKGLNQIFISDESAKYVYGFDADTGKKLLCLYRGMKSGYITSVTLLNNGKFLAVNNIDRTIHIFDLDINHNDFSFSNLIYSITSDITEIYPKLRIRYQSILQNDEGSYYKNDFSEKGSVLYSDNNEELNVISYNGFAFKIRINFSNFEYKVVSKVEYIEKTMPKISLCNSGFEK
jgi:WD40 repeat protein